MFKITSTELKKSLNAVKENNLLLRIAGEQLINIDSNTINPLVNMYDILNGTLNMLNILKKRGFIDVKNIFEDEYEQTNQITIEPILHEILKIPLLNITTIYDKGDIVFIYPQNNKKSKYLRGIVDKYKYNRLFIHVFDITGTKWKVKNVYNIHKDYSYQYIIKIPMFLNNKTFNNLSVLKIDLSYFFKTLYKFELTNENNIYTIDKNNLSYNNNVWTTDNVNIDNYGYLSEQINILTINIDNIYNIVSSLLHFL